MLICAVLGSVCVGCNRGHGAIDPAQPEISAFVELMSPRDIEIQPFTQPISVEGDGQADAIEVILAASDCGDDPIKVVGTFQFELYERQLASGMKLGERLAYWQVEILDEQAYNDRWDRYAQVYRFPLEIQSLDAGEYILTAQFTGPTGEHLFNEFVLRFDGAAVPPLEPRYD